MRIGGPQEPQDHDISLPKTGTFAAASLLAILSAVLPWQPAGAQGAVPCTAIENDAERLACYDRALRGAPPTPAPAAQPPARTAPPAAAPAPQAAEEPRRERRAGEPAPPAVSAPPAASAPRAAPAAPAASRNDNDEKITPIVIVGVRVLPGRETTFTAQDGTVWVQTDSQRIVGLPDAPFDAEIKSGAMGSYFLVPKDRARAIRVRQAR